MFWKKDDKDKRIKSTVLDAQEKELIDLLGCLPPDSAEYGKVVQNLKKLYEARETGYGHDDKSMEPIDWIVKVIIPVATIIVPVAAQTKQVRWALGIEETAAITTKATQFMTKLKRQEVIAT